MIAYRLWLAHTGSISLSKRVKGPIFKGQLKSRRYVSQDDV